MPPPPFSEAEVARSLVPTRHEQPTEPGALRIWLETNVPTRYEMRMWAKVHRVNAGTCLLTIIGTTVVVWFASSFACVHVLQLWLELYAGHAGTQRVSATARYVMQGVMWVTICTGVFAGARITQSRASKHGTPMTLGMLFFGTSLGLLCSFPLDLILADLVKN